MPASLFGGNRIRSAKRQVYHPFRKWARELAHPKEAVKEGAVKEEVPRVGVGNKEGEVAEAEHPHEDLRLLVEVALGGIVDAMHGRRESIAGSTSVHNLGTRHRQ